MEKITILVPAGYTVTGVDKNGCVTGSISATYNKDVTVTADIIAGGVSTILEYRSEEAYIQVWCYTYKVEKIFKDDPKKEDE